MRNGAAPRLLRSASRVGGNFQPLMASIMLLRPDHVAGGVGHGDHEVEDDVFGEQVEEVIAVRVYAQAFLYDAQERQ